jgi:2',3'-cyclic-nucleotide 2'-phosphodiesterase/3'-nucleotidase/5'-nucleotidase
MKKNLLIATLVLALAFSLGQAAPAISATTIQILHASDLEGGVEAIPQAHKFAAIIEKLKSQTPRTLVISAGDNYLSGPFFSASNDRSLRDVLRKALNNPDAREGVGRVDISIMNLIGFHASALGNHEFDLGTGTIRGIIAPNIREKGGKYQTRWLGAQFPYLSSNLDFSGDGSLKGLYSDKLLPKHRVYE